MRVIRRKSLFEGKPSMRCNFDNLFNTMKQKLRLKKLLSSAHLSCSSFLLSSREGVEIKREHETGPEFDFVSEAMVEHLTPTN